MKKISSTRFRLSVLTAVCFSLASASLQAARCTKENYCSVEESASLLAPVEALLSRCVTAFPDQSERYREAVGVYFDKLDKEAFEEIRSSAAYAYVMEQAKRRIDRSSPDELSKTCMNMLAHVPKSK